MAYQPIPGPVLGKVSHITSGIEPVTLSAAETSYLIFATRAIDGDTSNIVFAQLGISIMTFNMRPVEFFISITPAVEPPSGITGDPLVFAPVDSSSRVEVAFGNGSQEVSGGTMLGGRYVPGNSERSIEDPSSISDALGSQPVLAPGFVACFCARAEANNAQVTIRTSFREVRVDDNGNPVDRGIPTGT